jgi:biotin synthase-like enzyme
VKQADRVFDYIKEHGSITQMDASNELGVYCLPERIRDLRKAGIAVKSTLETSKNRWGEVCRYARYTL